ncbi:MAG: penicillin acylase family protein [Chloroflexi bacterium]|nr:penicillin acylase family protein [Chloroflexota bacterium]
MKRQLRNLGALLLGLTSVAGVGAYYFYRRGLSPEEGTLTIPGLDGRIEIIRDRWGIPHIYASSEIDLLFAQGWCHAQDRLWQLELNRRIGAGRLAEIFGDIALDADRWVRTIGLRRAAEAEILLLSPESRDGLVAYSRGINSFMFHHRGQWPIEFTLLRVEPEPWGVVDSLTWAKVMSWGLSVNWDAELVRARLVGKVGADLAAMLEPLYPDGHPLIVSPGIDYQRAGEGALSMAEAAQVYLHTAPRGVGMGSNNWALAGQKTVTGMPLLANDPHLTLMVPGVWYENHLVGGGYEVTGASFPGVPSVILGHNGRIAWGLTNGFPDVQDLYVERFNPDNPNQYLYQGNWEEAQVIREEIKVKGQETPVVLKVQVTRHGPVISPHMTGEDQPVALRWSAMEASDLFQAFRGINLAGNWEEFCQAISHFAAPSQNVVYADIEGNIGYHLTGNIPIRAKGDGRLPVPGWTGEYEWTGYIPFNELPQSYNPEKGYLVTANNRQAGEDFPHWLGAEFMNGYRARRISDLIESKERLSIGDCAAIQMDQFSIPGLKLARILTENITATPIDNDPLRQALNYLQQWDGVLSAQSVAGAIIQITQMRLLRNILTPKLGAVLTDSYLGVGGNLIHSPVNALHGRATPLLLNWLAQDDGAILPSEGRSVLLRRSLQEAIDWLRAELGTDLSTWQWGRLHRVSYSHLMGMRKPLDRLFNRGSFPIGGDTDTVFQTAFILNGPDLTAMVVPAYRQICDLQDWTRSISIHAVGQSGQPASKHYNDLAELWRGGDYHPMLWDRSSIEREVETRFTMNAAPREGLQPENGLVWTKTAE